MVTLADLSVPAPEPGPDDWNDEGVVILEGALNPDAAEAYMAEWSEANGLTGISYGPLGEAVLAGEADPHQPQPPLVLDAERPGGWPHVSPYMDFPALMALCVDPVLAEVLEELIGQPAGVHLNLTGWVSTQRNWHQDGYLNPAHVGDQYAAVWMALDDIHPESGVFQYIPGSHRWHRLVRSEVGKHVDLRDPAWPTHTEAILTDLVAAEVIERGAKVVSYVPKRGDILIWHPRLYHRGSAPSVPNAYRPALIAHYSGIKAHPELPKAAQHALGGWYYPLHTDHPV
jgi:hypothetical protein